MQLYLWGLSNTVLHVQVYRLQSSYRGSNGIWSIFTLYCMVLSTVHFTHIPLSNHNQNHENQNMCWMLLRSFCFDLSANILYLNSNYCQLAIIQITCEGSGSTDNCYSSVSIVQLAFFHRFTFPTQDVFSDCSWGLNWYSSNPNKFVVQYIREDN